VDDAAGGGDQTKRPCVCLVKNQSKGDSQVYVSEQVIQESTQERKLGCQSRAERCKGI
jgi:hypothetical protein